MSSASINDRISDYSLLSSTFIFDQSDEMGCASSQTGNIPRNSGSDKSAGDNDDGSAAGASAKYPPAEAFEISLDDVDNNEDANNDDRSDSLIKKYPPKRLQKLVEQAATDVPPPTIEELKEKLDKAEVRRQQYMQKRIDNIITVTGKVAAVGGGTSQNDGDEQTDGADTLQVNESANELADNQKTAK